MTTAFGEKGLLSHDKKMVYADPARLAKVTAPALFLVGDRDRMCPPEGCRRTYQVIAQVGLHSSEPPLRAATTPAIVLFLLAHRATALFFRRHASCPGTGSPTQVQALTMISLHAQTSS